MKKTMIAALIATSATLVMADEPENMADGFKPETKEQRLSYGIGVMFGTRLSQDIDNLDIEAFTQGFSDVFEGRPPVMSQEEIAQTIQAFQQEKMAAAQAEQEQLANESKQASVAFLKEKESEEGVMKTESGLLFKVITEGEGAHPAAEDTVKVHYAGTLIDGTEFDSSYKRGEPISFPLNQVIPGWTEGLQLMSVGSKYELYIPSELAYGPGGTGPIPPHSALTFVVELLDIEKASAEEAMSEEQP